MASGAASDETTEFVGACFFDGWKLVRREAQLLSKYPRNMFGKSDDPVMICGG